MKEEYLLNGEVFTLADIESMAEDEGVDTQDIIDGYGFEPKPGGINTEDARSGSASAKKLPQNTSSSMTLVVN